jgi:hypothetical protein
LFTPKVTPQLAEILTLMQALQIRMTELDAEVAALHEENACLRDEVARKGNPPSWAKPKTSKPTTKSVCKRRGQGYDCTCVAASDRTVEHAADVCTDCGQQLT